VDIKVYSNASRVNLRVNGVDQQPGQQVDNYQYLWTALPLAPGENVVEAYALGPSDIQLAQDSLVWTRQ
jgi:hypothetical protein